MPRRSLTAKQREEAPYEELRDTAAIGILTAAANERGHRREKHEGSIHFLKRIIYEAATRAEIAEHKSWRRRQKRRNRSKPNG